MNTFSIEGFARSCKQAMSGAADRCRAAADCLQKALRDNDEQHIIDTLNAAVPAGADIGEMIVHTSPELTMLYGRVPPRFRSGIHNHTVFACIGQLRGAEVNTVYEKTADGKGLTITSTRAVSAGEVISLAEDAIHHIENPNNDTGYALHIYGGDFNAVMDERSLWSEEDHRETGFSFQGLLRESVKGMLRSDNSRGLDALAQAIPAARPMIDARTLGDA